MASHLNLLEIETARTGEADPALVDHLAACAECRAISDGLSDIATTLKIDAAIVVPEASDRAVLNLGHARAAEIREHARKRPHRPWRKLALVVPLAVAAIVALVLVAPVLLERSPSKAAPASVSTGPDDVNRDGKIDILDAFAIARAIESGRPAATHDTTGDGRVDRADVDRIALSAVTLGRARGSR